MINHSSVKSYSIGFFISLAITLLSYFPVAIHMNSGHKYFSHELLIPWVLSLAVLQLVVQLIFFLHLGKEKGPKWNMAMFVSTLSIILLVVLGSLWIMYHLNYNMMPKQVEEFIIQDEAFHN